MRDSSKNYFIPIVLAIIFFVSIIFVSKNFIYQAKKANDELISEHIAKLDNIFKKINSCCGIIGFKSEKNYIDFLNVKEFIGTTLGPLILAKPNNWQGPYLKENLTIDGKEYQIVKASDGYYLVPGDGVAFSNGKIVGKTLIIDSGSNVANMMNNPKYLLSNGNVLAAYIELSENPEKKQNDELIAEQIQKLKEIFKKINEACKIIGFRHEKDYVDFLNVKSFSGSIVGSMNVLKPENWKGPYLENNLTVDGKHYQIVNTKKGYYILPPDNINISNGKIIGLNIFIKYDSDVDQLIRDPNGLNSNGRPLAVKIDTIQDPFEKLDKSDFLDEEGELL